jgi:bifunctional non-homologous end joining protein LigD
VPEGERWLHEIKWDGYRLAVRIDSGRVRLLTRGGLDWTERFPSIMEAAKALDVRTAYLDGEAVVEERGIPDFGALQAALAAGPAHRALLFAFDLLHLDGRDLRREPLMERKALLERLLEGKGSRFCIRFSEHLLRDGPALYRQAQALGLEGIVSKRRDCPYRSGRPGDWLKIKAVHRQEFVIAGYIPHKNSSRAVGSLSLGHYVDGKLVYVGRAGTGYTARSARELWEKLHPLERPTAPFAAGRPKGVPAKMTRWVEPRLVAEVEFRAWTTDRQLRHASFKGLREDKPAQEVLAEGVPAREEAPTPPPTRKAARPARKATEPTPEDSVQRLLPEAVAPFRDALAAYWRKVGKTALAHLGRRPLTLVRHEGGRVFFHKGPFPETSAAVHRLAMTKSGGEEGTRLWVDSVAGLVGLAEIGVVEIHPWGSTVDDIERPDVLVLDLDPGEGIEWPFVMETALRVREVLAGEGLESWPKTTGGKGLHVMVPVAGEMDWPAAKAHARRLAERVAATDPERYTTSSALAKRRGRLFLDYLRVGRGTTAVGAFSPRARPGFPVAAPVTWREVERGVRPDTFSMERPPQRGARRS